eukprot:282160-Chlamydomonas_euryale.AAC.2
MLSAALKFTLFTSCSRLHAVNFMLKGSAHVMTPPCAWAKCTQQSRQHPQRRGCGKSRAAGMATCMRGSLWKLIEQFWKWLTPSCAQQRPPRETPTGPQLLCAPRRPLARSCFAHRGARWPAAALRTETPDGTQLICAPRRPMARSCFAHGGVQWHAAALL